MAPRDGRGRGGEGSGVVTKGKEADYIYDSLNRTSLYPLLVGIVIQRVGY